MSVFDRLGSIVSSTSTDESLPRSTIDLDIDTALSLLANERRRLTLRFAIEDAGEEFDLVEAVRYIATYEYGTGYTGSERKRVYISLYQSHLPELVDAGILDRVDDGEGHTFRVAEPARPLYNVLDVTTALLGGEE
ncbi:hypothetical protein C461_03267 [Halorubrum aidingense JCM 13560]|uniref:DUF7344 domain-containing protein n=1 Tax=Halorubrum aidingense JCM 13560 TaxID=1230454 RepID=M0PGE7_9EURY|nr:hypothetical protein [Halorubrum aidingense]EMA69162.1 hypothetical protein C461_03267 [Halorubrum aidingense JCM 13560]